MATEEKENLYQGGQGTGGKFRKRPFRKSQTTPYSRPPTAVRNPIGNNNGGWLTKLVDPAHRLITRGAHSLFSSLLRKRLPPPPPAPRSPDTEQEVTHSHQKEDAFVSNISSSKQQGAVSESNVQGAVGESSVQINCSDGGGLTELEKLLKQKTFTRSEIDHLTALMRSRTVRTVDEPVREEKNTELVPSEPMLPCGQKEEYPKTPAIENVIENHLMFTPQVTSTVPIVDVASPAELAKAYMGDRHSKVFSSMLGIQNPVPGEDPTRLKSESFPYKSPAMSIVPRATRHAAVHENGFVTPRSRGRSAIYSMARTPYARHPTSALKRGGFAVQGECSTQSVLDHEMLSGSKQGLLKNRNFALDNDIGSGGPIRRFRHKSNLYSKGSSLPLSSSALSISRSGLGNDASQQPSSSMQKSILPNEIKHSHMELSEENVDDTKPSMSISPFSLKSSEMASKIMHQLDKLVSPKEKSSNSRLPTVNDNSSLKLSPSMLHGKALRSIEIADSSKLLDNLQGNKSGGAFRHLSASAQHQELISQRDKVENGPLKLVTPSDEFVPGTTATHAMKTTNQVLSSEKYINSDVIKSASHPTHKRRAFHMSAQEYSLDLDDNAYPNGAFLFSSGEKETRSSTATEAKFFSGSETVAQENPSTLSAVMPSKGFIADDEARANAADGLRVSNRVEVPTSTISSISDPTYKPATVAVQAATLTSFVSDKPASPNGSIANHSLFNFGNKMVSSRGLTGIGAPSKDITISAPIFGLEKVVSSREPGADAPPANFCTNKNVDNVSPFSFTASKSVGGESTLKFSAASESQLGSSISTTTVIGATDSVPKVRESGHGDAEINKDIGFSVRTSELAVSPVASTSSSTSPSSMFNFGHSSNLNNGFLASNNFTTSNLSHSASCGISATAATTGMTMETPSSIASSNNNSSSTPGLATSSSTPSFFKFGSSPSSSTALPVSSSVSAPLETKSMKDAGTGNLSSVSFSGGSSAAFGSTGSAIFGFSSPAMTAVTSQSKCSVLGAQTSSTSGFVSSTQIQSVPFSSSASSQLFGLTGNTASGSSLFPSSSSVTNIFNSSTTFGVSTPASSSVVNSVSSNSSSSLFGTSSWQPSKSPFGSTSSSSSSSGFFVGISAASVASTSSPAMFSAPQFSFTSAAANTSSQPAFGSPNPGFSFGSAPVNNGQTSMEDSMAEDNVQGTPPVTPMFGQQPASVQSNFAFGAKQSGTSPFQFGNQQSIAPQNPFGSQQSIAPQNPSPFQASGSLEFNGEGGSFSLGSGGGEKSGRKFVRVKRRQGKK